MWYISKLLNNFLSVCTQANVKLTVHSYHNVCVQCTTKVSKQPEKFFTFINTKLQL